MDEGFAEYRRYVKDALPDLSDLEIEEAWMQWPYSPVHVMKRAPDDFAAVGKRKLLH